MRLYEGYGVFFLKAHGCAIVSDMVTLTGASRNTLKQHFKILVEKRDLALNGKGRGAWYSLV